MKKSIIIPLVLILAFFTGGCSFNNSSESFNDSENYNISENLNEDTKITITDNYGVTAEVPKNCTKIACTWTSGTELLISLGLGDLLTACPEEAKNKWCTKFYPEISSLKTCSHNSDAEAVLNLNADIVLTSNPAKAEEWRKKGINAITFSYYSIDQMKNSLDILSKISPPEYAEKCTKYTEYLDSSIKKVNDALEGKVEKKELLYYINASKNDALNISAGRDTINECWAEKAFADFATSDILGPYEYEADIEAVLSKNPSSVIIGGKYKYELYDRLLSSEEWKDTDAVKNKKVYIVPSSLTSFDHFGAEFALMVPWLVSTLYPEYFKFDAESEIKNFYSEFAGYDLTDEEVSLILKGLAPDGEKY